MRKKKGTSRDRNSKYSKDWAKKVKDRDGNKCMKCGSQNKLHAHHIIPWRVNKFLRFDISNGTTLCNSCHAIEEGFQIGHKHSIEIIEKIKESKKKSNLPHPMLGRKHSSKSREKMSIAKIGHKPWNTGKKKKLEKFKKCKVCNVEKSQEKFTPSGKGYTRNECKDCRNVKLRESWYLRREKINKKRRDLRKIYKEN